MGDIYDLREKEYIPKVMLEEKMFKTWYSGRYVLMGDGAVTAMHDAIALANLFYAMPAKTPQEVTRIIEEYHAERYPAVMESFKDSQLMAKVMSRGLTGKIFLNFITRVPMRLWRMIIAGSVRYHPQVGFLEPIHLMSSVAPVVSSSTERARAVFVKQKQSATAVVFNMLDDKQLVSLATHIQ
ncbi:hypothetical protein BGX23_003112 [Mortierella sp. AD031]|nr:hypothetical protein BGX23_003112 [Mortierella sp. AD031]